MRPVLKKWKKVSYPSNIRRRMNLQRFASTILLVLGGTIPSFCTDDLLSSFLGKATFEKQRLFDDQRYPNVVVSNKGTILSVWGNDGVFVRRSEDGGKSWKNIITVSKKGYHSGGTTVDRNSGDILVFIEDRQPPAPLTVYRSQDDGRSWHAQSTIIEKDEAGNSPSMHMNEHGITLRHGKFKGRMIRPTRWYAGKNDRSLWPKHYTNAIYSDDGGKTWETSDPFPANGTGEATVAELSDGTIYYNTRRHWAEEGADPKRRWTATSTDGGKTWTDLKYCRVLPDGPQNTNYGCMAGLTRLAVTGKDILIYSNCDSPAGRKQGTVWASFDGGKSWPIKRLVFAGSHAYSSITSGRPGTKTEGMIYHHFEGGPKGGSAVAKFNLSWILGGEKTGDGDVPSWVK